MTKEEYKKNLVRMWDSLRIKHKGENGCVGVNCNDCPCYERVCNKEALISHAYEAIEVVEKWAKEKNQTNAEKFREVFGFEPNVFMDDEEHVLCNGYRTIDERFWNSEYKPTKEGEE